MALSELEVGSVIGEERFALSGEAARAYAEAVGDASPLAADGLAPPMALIAAGLSRVIETLGLGGGTVHASQEVEFVRPVGVGEEVIARAVLRGNTVRRGSRFATVETVFTGADGGAVARSVSMVIVPQ